MKYFFAYAGGLAGYFFMEGFIRLIIMFYHRADFQFYGISHLPGREWVFTILAAVLVISWLSGMLVLSIIKIRPLIHSVIFASLFVFWRCMEMFRFYQSEPQWYFILLILIHTIGIFLAYNTYIKQYENSSDINS